MTDDDSILMTAEAVSAYLGIPINTLYGWKYRGEGPSSFRVGRHLRYRRGDVDRWLESRRAEKA